jgi:hypothetical protein
MTRLKTSEQIARDMLRDCCKLALARLENPHAHIETITKQLEQTARLVQFSRRVREREST